jgi:hypothetical protein
VIHGTISLVGLKSIKLHWRGTNTQNYDQKVMGNISHGISEAIWLPLCRGLELLFGTKDVEGDSVRNKNACDLLLQPLVPLEPACYN